MLLSRQILAARRHFAMAERLLAPNHGLARKKAVIRVYSDRRNYVRLHQ